ncbi:MAG TPA: hypothetical protein VFU17_08340 [Candidatus Limnocylindrales bacterium]|nr:hypothetical protein [Candidatus Limnocylindrales bacterium]
MDRPIAPDKSRGHGVMLRLRIEAEGAGHGGTLQDALDQAERRLGY